MDLRFTGGSPTPAERAAVDSVLGPAEQPPLTGHAARARRTLLLPVLVALTDQVGTITHAALDHVGQRLSVPPAEAYGVASFYELLWTGPRPRTVVSVCDDIACRSQGAEKLCAALEAAVGPAVERPGSSTAEFGWRRSPCLGRCESGSAALVQHAPGGAAIALAPVSAEELLALRTPA
ncbi:MAG: NADH-quinone oxidoreductase subunit NuoE family protein, partial [Actinomycetes bacterium]